MRKIKSYRKFNESSNYNISLIKDMLLDFTDKDVHVGVSEGSWILLQKPVDWVRVNLGGYNHIFTLEPCLLDLLDYMENCGLKLMSESWKLSATCWMSKEDWQYYVGCPNCLSEDIEDNYNLTMKTICHNCGYMEPADRFLVDRWPVDRKVIEEVIRDGREIGQLQLTFSDRKSLVKESFNQADVDEIKSTVYDMLLELQFIDITPGVWVMSDKAVQVELRKPVKDKSSAVLWGDRTENRSFDWSDVKEVVDGVSEYLSDFGFSPYWTENPKLEVRANWRDGGGENHGYDSVMFLRWNGVVV